MWSEKRNLDNTIFFDLVSIFSCILGNISFYLYKYNIALSLYQSFNIEITNFMAILPIIFTLIVSAVNFNINIEAEKLYELKKSMFKYKLINIFFIAYILFALLIVKDKSVVLSSLLMKLAYICVYIIKGAIKK